MKAEPGSIALLLVTLWPLMLGTATLLRPSRSAAMRLAPWAALPALALAILTPPSTSLNLPWLLLGTELNLIADTDRMFFLFTALLWWVAGLFARAYLPDTPRKPLFFACFLASMAGNLGLILAHDLVSFYTFFALMSFSAYGLVLHQASAEAVFAGRIYIALVVLGELALFAALALAASTVNDLSFDAVRLGLAEAEFRDLVVLLALVGFGVKVGVLGLHGWLPLAHPVAPSPASAVLSGAMIKAGLIGWLRLLPLGEAVLMGWGKTFIILGLGATFYGAAIGLTQRDAKTLLAYSSVSQMGILTAAVGLALTAPPAAFAVISGAIVVYALNHGLSKAALFLGVGVLNASRSGHQYWIRMALWLPALALAGAPFTCGMLAKGLLKEQTIYAPDSWAMLLNIALPVSALVTALLMARFLFVIAQATTHSSGRVASSGIIWPWALLTAVLMLSPWWAMLDLSTMGSRSSLIGSLWPLVIAAAIATFAIYRRPEPGKRVRPYGTSKILQLQVPPGDLLLPISRFVAFALKSGRYMIDEPVSRWNNKAVALLLQAGSFTSTWRWIRRIEDMLGRWPFTVLMLMLLVVLVVWFGLSS